MCSIKRSSCPRAYTQPHISYIYKRITL